MNSTANSETVRKRYSASKEKKTSQRLLIKKQPVLVNLRESNYTELKSNNPVHLHQSVPFSKSGMNKTSILNRSFHHVSPINCDFENTNLIKPPNKLKIKNNFSNNLKRKKMTIDPTIINPPSAKLKSHSIVQTRRNTFLKNKSKLIKNIVHNKQDRTVLNEKYKKYENLGLSTLTPFYERESPAKQNDNCYKNQRYKELESLSQSDMASPSRPQTTKFDHKRGKSCNQSQMEIKSNKYNFFTPFMSINLRMKYVKNSGRKKSKGSKSKKERSVESIYLGGAKNSEKNDIRDTINKTAKSKEKWIISNRLLQNKIQELEHENFSLMKSNAKLISQIETLRQRSTLKPVESPILGLKIESMAKEIEELYESLSISTNETEQQFYELYKHKLIQKQQDIK